MIQLPTHQTIRLQQRGFTLIELLVVIAIIGILASATLSSLQDTRALARDSVRLSDMKQIRTALEQFHLQNGRYPDWTHDQIPTSGEYIGTGDKIDEALSPYLNPIPRDPLHDGVLYYYSYDPVHMIDHCDTYNDDWGAVFAFNKAEKTGNLHKDTCVGPNKNQHNADFNQAIILDSW